MVSIALHNPKIPQNTGNIARLAVGLDIELILVGKLGFSLHDKYLKRAGLDYWDHLKLKVFKEFEQFVEYAKGRRIVLATTKGKNPYYEYRYKKNDILLFGSETKGLPEDYIKEHIEDTITIPMPGEVRSLNLANSVSVITYHSLIELNYFEGFKVNKNFKDLNI